MKTIDPSPLATDEPMPLVRGVFEPPQGRVVTALARNKRLIAAFAALGVLFGVALGLARPTTYEASTTLQVGQVNPNSPGFFSYVQSSSSLATVFSRSIEAAPVLSSIQSKFGLASGAASSRLSSEPIPLSPAFRVIATGPSAAQAIRLANVAAESVIAYENKQNSANPQAASLLASYRRASEDLKQAAAKVAALGPGASTSDLLRAEAERKAVKLRLKAIASAYVATVGSEPPRVGLVSLVAGATSATSDRTSKVQLLGFLGLLVGAVAGCAVALLRSNRRRRRVVDDAGSGSPPA